MIGKLSMSSKNTYYLYAIYIEFILNRNYSMLRETRCTCISIYLSHHCINFYNTDETFKEQTWTSVEPFQYLARHTSLKKCIKDFLS